jgi:demethylmenaquinone methyltransferase/2-methoxy-6-polyprenyl-1,4-benzoquinol methylase
MVKKRSWYDGWFYSWFIDRQKSIFRRKILRSIPPDLRVMDVGCGTGGLCLDLAEKAKYVVGVDISEAQILVAEKRKNKSGQQNLRFKPADAKNLQDSIDEQFDIITLLLIIHEVVESDRNEILQEIKNLTKKILVLDYSENMNFNFWGVMTYIIEYFAGREHFANFKNYLHNGGIIPLLEGNGFKIEKSRLDPSGVFRFTEATW